MNERKFVKDGKVKVKVCYDVGMFVEEGTRYVCKKNRWRFIVIFKDFVLFSWMLNDYCVSPEDVPEGLITAESISITPLSVEAPSLCSFIVPYNEFTRRMLAFKNLAGLDIKSCIVNWWKVFGDNSLVKKYLYRSNKDV